LALAGAEDRATLFWSAIGAEACGGSFNDEWGAAGGGLGVLLSERGGTAAFWDIALATLAPLG